MKTLLVKYLPSGEHSNTAKLLQVFLKELGDRSIEVLDLAKTPAPTFSVESMAAYKKRNYMGQKLDAAEASSLAANDKLVAQLKSANVVVLAYPMHNFGMPGPVKSYMDSIMLNGETFEMGKKLMAGRKALTIFTSGGLYPENQVSLEYPNWDTVSVLAKINFSFMGFDEAEVISTSLRDETKSNKRLEVAQEKFKKIISRWY